jgi:hypothetical protein
MSAQTLYRWSAAALVVSALSVTVGRIIHPTVDAAGLTSPLWGWSHVLWLAGLVTGMAGVTGLYLRHRAKLGRLGVTGAALGWLGMALLSGAIYFEAVIEPALLDRAPELVDVLVDSAALGSFLAVFLASVMLFAVGFLLFGIALLRARVSPRWAVLLVIAGSVIGGPQGFLPPPVAIASFLALGTGLAALGYGLWTSVESPTRESAVAREAAEPA